MTRGILIIGAESSLFSAVAAEAAKRVEAFAVAMIPSRLSSEGEQPLRTGIPEKAIPLSWNPASPISARTLVFAAENRMKRIHDAILICSPPAIYKNAETITPEEIEILVNDHIKGWFLLIRELAIYFRRVGAGSMALVENAASKNRDRNSPANLLGTAAAASFRAFAEGMLSSSLNEPYHTMGFTGSETHANEKFAAWLFKIIDNSTKKDSGRWHKYSMLKNLKI